MHRGEDDSTWRIRTPLTINEKKGVQLEDSEIYQLDLDASRKRLEGKNVSNSMEVLFDDPTDFFNTSYVFFSGGVIKMNI